MNICAYTPDGNSHPPYLSLNDDEGEVSLTVRQGPADNFKQATIKIPIEELIMMHVQIGAYIEQRQTE